MILISYELSRKFLFSIQNDHFRHKWHQPVVVQQQKKSMLFSIQNIFIFLLDKCAVNIWIHDTWQTANGNGGSFEVPQCLTKVKRTRLLINWTVSQGREEKFTSFVFEFLLIMLMCDAYCSILAKWVLSFFGNRKKHGKKTDRKYA